MSDYIWYRDEDSQELVSIPEEHEGEYVVFAVQNPVSFAFEDLDQPYLQDYKKYRKHRTKWGNYLLPEEWKIQVLKQELSCGYKFEFKDARDLMTMHLSDRAEADGTTIIRTIFTKIDDDFDTMTKTYLAEAVGYKK